MIFLLAPPRPTIPAFPTWKNQKLHSVVEGKAAGEGLPRSRKGCHSSYAELLAVQLAVKQTTSKFQTGKHSGSRHSNGKVTGKIQTQSREEHLTQGTNPSLGWDTTLTVELGRREEDENKEKGREEDLKAL